MIRNGLYALSVELQDGIEGGDNGVVVLRDGAIRGGDSFFYFVGSYSCSGSKWRGEVTSREHTPALATKPFARKVATIGFTGTCSDVGAESDNTALLGKRSVSFKTRLRLLVADDEDPLIVPDEASAFQDQGGDRNACYLGRDPSFLD